MPFHAGLTSFNGFIGLNCFSNKSISNIFLPTHIKINKLARILARMQYHTAVTFPDLFSTGEIIIALNLEPPQVFLPSSASTSTLAADITDLLAPSTTDLLTLNLT